MKILFFSPYFYPYISGLTVYPQRILNHLSKKHHVTVLTFNHLTNSLKISNFKLKIISLPYWFKISKGFISPPSLIKFWRHGRSADIIILNQPNFEGLFLAIFARILRKKIISIVHCQVFLPKSFFNLIINFFLNLSFYLQLWISNIIVPTTQDYADSLLFGRLFNYKIKPIYPPIIKPAISPQFINELSRQKKEFWVGYVGRMASEKGLEYLVQSFNRLKEKVKNIRLVFAGPDPAKIVGENSYWLKLAEQLREQKINYLFFKDLTDDQLGAFYKIIDVLILPSVNQTEAFSMVQVEAMLLGTTVVTTNLPGVRVPIKLTKMGLLVEPKNSKQLTKAIITILKNKNKYPNPKLVENVQHIFDIKKTFQFYDDLVDHANPYLRMTS